MPKNDQIWPKIGIFVHFGPGLAGSFDALLVGRLGVVARGLYLARHLSTLYILTVGQDEQGQTSAMFLEIFKSNVIAETGFKAVGLERDVPWTITVDQEDQGQTSERILEFSKET